MWIKKWMKMVVNLSSFRLERQMRRSQKKIESLRFNEAFDRSVGGDDKMSLIGHGFEMNSLLK